MKRTRTRLAALGLLAQLCMVLLPGRAAFAAELPGEDAVLASGASVQLHGPFDSAYIMAYVPAYTQSVNLGSAVNASAAVSKASDYTDAGEIEIDGAPRRRVEYHGLGPLDGPKETEDGPGFFAAGSTRSFYRWNTAASNWKPAAAFECVAQGNGYEIWILADDPRKAAIEERLEDLQAGFARGLQTIERLFGEITDTDGPVTIRYLLYPIDPLQNAIVGGLTVPAELYRLSGNRGAYLHLDTGLSLGSGTSAAGLDIDSLISTMVHETQHLSCFYSYSASAPDTVTGLSWLAGQMPPTWVNEGLSMAAEHAFGGVLTNRLREYTLYGEGRQVTPSDEEFSVYNYALDYLFFQYVRTHGDEAFLREFYGSYSGDISEALTRRLQRLPDFAELDLDGVIQHFFMALLLNDEGLYGFGSENALFSGAQPAVRDALPATLRPGAAAYLKTAGSAYTPAVQEGVVYAGLTPRAGYPPGREYGLGEWISEALPGARNDSGALFGNAQSDGSFRIYFWEGQAVPGFVTVAREDGTALSDTSTLPSGTTLRLTAQAQPNRAFDGWELLSGDMAAGKTISAVVGDGGVYEPKFVQSAVIPQDAPRWETLRIEAPEARGLHLDTAAGAYQTLYLAADSVSASSPVRLAVTLPENGAVQGKAGLWRGGTYLSLYPLGENPEILLTDLQDGDRIDVAVWGADDRYPVTQYQIAVAERASAAMQTLRIPFSGTVQAEAAKASSRLYTIAPGNSHALLGEVIQEPMRIGDALQYELEAGTAYRLEFGGASSGYLKYAAVFTMPEDGALTLPQVTLYWGCVAEDAYAITVADLAALLSWKGMESAPEKFDCNGNGAVDVLDIGVLLENIGRYSRGNPLNADGTVDYLNADWIAPNV